MDEHKPKRKEGVEGRIRRRSGKAVASRRVFGYLAGATAVIGISAGVLVTIIDHQDFPTIGDGIWWAIVTLGTVGYGDIVPHTAWGRVVGSVVIVVGVTFISFLTATVTSMFVSADQDERAAAAADERASREEETQAMLQQLLDRTTAIEAKLEALVGEEPEPSNEPRTIPR
jgi:voltage-gated potassium channel